MKKKYLLRTLVFALAFIIGIAPFRLAFYFETEQISDFQTISESETSTAVRPDGQIEVHFREFVKGENGLELKFEIANKTAHSVYYPAYSDERNEAVGGLMDYVKIDGHEPQSQWSCWTGTREFELKPGQTIELSVSEWNLAERIRDGEKFQIGFTFTFKDNKNYQKYWSENLPIAPELKKRLIRKSKQIEKNNG